MCRIELELLHRGKKTVSELNKRDCCLLEWLFTYFSWYVGSRGDVDGSKYWRWCQRLHNSL